MGSTVKKIASVALPILGTMVMPGVGTALGSTLSGAALSGIGGALGGAAGGAVGGGGLKSALTGAALGGAGGYLSGGGSILGQAANTLPAGVSGPVSPGSGIAGALTRSGSSTLSSLGRGIGTVASSLGDFTGGAAGAGAESVGSGIGTSLASGLKSAITSGIQQSQQEDAAKKALSAVNPYLQYGTAAAGQLADNLSSGFDASSLQDDEGYKFRLKQGQDALNASLAAQGMSDSGEALKAAMEYGQNFANSEYSDAYQRWLDKNQQLSGLSGYGQTAAGSVGDIYGNLGNVKASGTGALSDALNPLIAAMLRGRGYA